MPVSYSKHHFASRAGWRCPETDKSIIVKSGPGVFLIDFCRGSYFKPRSGEHHILQCFKSLKGLVFTTIDVSNTSLGHKKATLLHAAPFRMILTAIWHILRPEQISKRRHTSDGFSWIRPGRTRKEKFLQLRTLTGRCPARQTRAIH